MLVDNCCLLNYSVLKQLQKILIVTDSLCLYCDQHHFFELPNNFIVSYDKNSNL